MRDSRPTLIAADLEGVFLPEIWIAVAEKTGIADLRLTTRDVADYAQLMQHRIQVLADHKIKLADLQAVIATMEPLAGAADFMKWIRHRTRLIILTDSFYEFIDPFMAKLDYPTVFAHQVQVDQAGFMVGYRLRTNDSKRATVEAMSQLGFRTLAFGDSYNDTTMLGAADQGILFRPPAKVSAEFPQYPVASTYTEMGALLAAFLSEDFAQATG